MKIKGKDIAALLHGIHQHDEKTEEIVYYEKDLLPVLKALGLPDPKWELSMSIKEWKKYKAKKKHKMKKGEKAYQKLKKHGLTDKEIAEAFILPHDLTKKEKAKADKDLSEALKKLRAKRSKTK